MIALSNNTTLCKNEASCDSYSWFGWLRRPSSLGKAHKNRAPRATEQAARSVIREGKVGLKQTVITQVLALKTQVHHTKPSHRQLLALAPILAQPIIFSHVVRSSGERDVKWLPSWQEACHLLGTGHCIFQNWHCVLPNESPTLLQDNKEKQVSRGSHGLMHQSWQRTASLTSFLRHAAQIKW